MSCPICGEECRCSGRAQARRGRRFQPSWEGADDSAGTVLIDPEAYDGSEQEFTASLETQAASTGMPRFVLDTEPVIGRQASEESAMGSEPTSESAAPEQECGIAFVDSTAGEAESLQVPGVAIGMVEEDPEGMTPAGGGNLFGDDPDGTHWRDEVAARLHSYQSRRRSRRSPKYPSLNLKFDPPAHAWTPPPRAANASPGTPVQGAVAEALVPAEVQNVTEAAPDSELHEPVLIPADGSNVIEFPRPLMPPTPPADELAEAIIDKPRILEAPEAVPKQVPLGGIILEPEEPMPTSEFEVPLQVAPLDRRLLAAAIDGLFVVAASAMFVLIASRLAPMALPLRAALALAILLPSFLWTIYQYLMLVYAGTTPGLRLAHLRLSRFDGTPAEQGIRRWRALAMALSGVSLGLGFLWCVLDEDALCWHDRISATYLAPTGPEGSAFLAPAMVIAGWFHSWRAAGHSGD